MGNQLTTGKRDKEKQRLAKRQEKQKRKESRQRNSKGGALEDMLAYVDENGVITSTPPDLTKKEEVKLEDIAISTAKTIASEGPVTYQGRVEYYNSEKYFGFIKDLNSTEKYFFHISNAPSNIAIGNKVTFELERGPKGMNAIRIALVRQ